MENIDNIIFNPDFHRALRYFQSLEQYEPSPLKALTAPCGITMRVKDETDRMGLGAFKALGGPYAVALLLAREWVEKTGETLTPERFQDANVREFAQRRTFVTASAGNHGIGVAAGAKALGANARIYLAKTVPDSFDARLQAHGAEVVRAGETYGDSVAEAVADTQRSGAILLADGTWPGYTEIPKLVMEGYTVIAEEMRSEFEASGNWPTHVYLQAGVGGLAAAMAHMIRDNWARQPELIVVEPEAATCLRDSHLAGKPTRADGPDSTMGRLDCKEVSMVAWHTLERCGVSYVALSEEEGEAAAQAVTNLGVPTTPSGAAGYGALLKQYGNNAPAEDFRPLIIVTECPA
jgi:diaminopropionate ammonia-lyase